MDATKTGRNCSSCKKDEAEVGKQLKACAKCRQAFYCTRDCQKSDWKQHKKGCSSNVAARVGSTSSSTTEGNNASNQSTTTGDSANASRYAIDQPFHRLKAKTWIHGRPEEDVYKLLVDTYSLRVDDDYKFGGQVDDDCLYSGARSNEPGFRRFLGLAEKKRNLLPPWWSREKAEACVSAGLRGGPKASLRCAVEKSDIVEEYGSPLMPMQMRMFGEQVYGTGPRGMGGSAMMEMRMMMERGDSGPQSTLLDMSNSFARR